MKRVDVQAARETGTRRRGYLRVVAVLLALIVALNLATLIPGFADWYVGHAYPVLTLPLARLSELSSLPAGELVMYGGIAALLVGLVLAVFALFLRRHRAFVHVAGVYWKSVLAVVLVVGLLFTLNWAIPFRATPLRAVYGAGADASLEQLEALRNRIVAGLDQAASECPRDEAGQVAYEGDLDARVAAALNGAGDEFARLKGHYPAPKAALCSDVLEWMGIGGYTYPYTQEVTYNRYVSRLYYPVLSAHELVHHQGYFMEDDAEFLSFLALSRNDDALLRYSAYEHMYYYVEGAYEARLVAELGQEGARARYEAQPQVSAQVRDDVAYDGQEREQRYENSVNGTLEGLFAQPAQDVSHAGWDTQAQVLQENAYDGVVGLLLAYYGG
ncbi:MAG: DUF3810 family protein [Coriobacteriales bacterium]